MPVDELVVAPHPLRGLKAGELGLIEAAATDECLDERLLDLVGFAIIGALKDHPCRVMSGVYAMDLGRRHDISPYLTARTAPQELIERLAAEIPAFRC